MSDAAMDRVHEVVTTETEAGNLSGVFLIMSDDEGVSCRRWATDPIAMMRVTPHLVEELVELIVMTAATAPKALRLPTMAAFKASAKAIIDEKMANAKLRTLSLPQEELDDLRKMMGDLANGTIEDLMGGDDA